MMRIFRLVVYSLISIVLANICKLWFNIPLHYFYFSSIITFVYFDIHDRIDDLDVKINDKQLKLDNLTDKLDKYFF